MEQNPPYTAPLNHPTPLISNSFSPVSNLLKTAWDKIQKQLLRLFILTIIGVAFGFAISLGMIALMVGVAALLPAASALSTVIGLIIVAISTFILMFTVNIGTMLLLANADPALSAWSVFRKSLKKILPVFWVSILSGFIVSGGLVLLVIPGILFGILLTFSVYFVVMDNVSPIEAMRKSVYIVSKNFGAIFIRLVVLFVIGFVGGLIISMLTGQDSRVLGSILSLIFNLLFGWYSISYMLSLFQEAKKTGGDGRGKLIWMSIMAIIGWLLIVGGGYLIFRATANNPAVNTNRPLQFDNTLLDLDNLDEIVATPTASVRPASASASSKASATPRPSAIPKASAATSSAIR